LAILPEAARRTSLRGLSFAAMREFLGLFSYRKSYRRATFYLNVILADWETILDSQSSLMNKSAKANV
jgi:hypothetical protein